MTDLNRSKKLNIRYIRWCFWRFTCKIAPSLRAKANFYEQGKQVSDFNISPFYKFKQIVNLKDTGQLITDEEKEFINQCWDKKSRILTDEVIREESLTLFKDVKIYGHTGSVICNDKVIIADEVEDKIINHNMCKPVFSMKKKPANSDTLYFNMTAFAKGHKHFYHFFVDLFPAVFTLITSISNRRKLEELGFKKLVILVREDLSSFQKQAYEHVEEKYPFIKIDFLKANEFIENINIAFCNIKQNIHNSYLSRSYIEFLKDIYAKELVENKSLEGKYYISREDVKNRNITNEKQILDALEKDGFKKLLPAKLTLQEQVKIFSSAETILGPAGAAFTNIIHANSNTKIVIIYPEGSVGSQYLWLAKSVGIKNISHRITDNGSSDLNHHKISKNLIKDFITHSC